MTLPDTDARILLLHYPRCGKSRAALSLLQEHEAPVDLRNYLDRPLSMRELRDLRRRIDRPVQEWIRRSDPVFEALGLSLEFPEEDLLKAIEEHPILLERPIAIRGERAVVGRPPENVLALLESE